MVKFCPGRGEKLTPSIFFEESCLPGPPWMVKNRGPVFHQVDFSFSLRRAREERKLPFSDFYVKKAGTKKRMDAEEGGRCEKVVKEKVSRQGRTGFRGFLNEGAARYGHSEKSSGMFKSRMA